MQMFFWASGYLYSDECEKNICGYLGRKVKRLLIPMVIYNIVYGLFTKVIRQFGFKIGGEITLYNIFISSFCYGSGFCFNSPDWFIAQLFIVEVLNVLVEKIVSFSLLKMVDMRVQNLVLEEVLQEELVV